MAIKHFQKDSTQTHGRMSAIKLSNCTGKHGKKDRNSFWIGDQLTRHVRLLLRGLKVFPAPWRCPGAL